MSGSKHSNASEPTEAASADGRGGEPPRPRRTLSPAARAAIAGLGVHRRDNP